MSIKTEMSVTPPSKTNPNPELVNALSGRHKQTLHRLFHAFRDSEERDHEVGAYTTEGWKKVLVHEYPDGVRQFLDAYGRIREESVRREPVIEHLAEQYDIPSEELDIDRLPELVALLMDYELLERLDEIIIAAKFRPSAITGTYVLDHELPVNDLEDRLETFHEKWNTSVEEEETKRSKRIDVEFESNQTVALQIYKESTMSTARYFSFRKQDSEERPAIPEIDEFPYRQLKRIRLLLVARDGETRLVFTKDLNGWKNSLRTIFSEVFDVDNIVSKMSSPASDVVANVEETATGDVSDDVDPLSETQSYIDDRCEIAKSEVESLPIPESDKEKLKDHLDSVNISGTEVDGDQSIAMRELRIISQSDIAELFASVDIEDGFRDLLRKANEEKLGFVLDVDGVPVECINGEWGRAGPGGLPDSIRRALQVFFDEEALI